MEVTDLRAPYSNGFADDKDPKAVEFLNTLLRVHEALDNGTLYARYTSGDREGSIAKLVRNDRYKQDLKPCIRYHGGRYSGDKDVYRFDNQYIYVVATWTGRKNKVQEYFPNYEAELLIGDDIETVWAKFDAKSAKDEVLKNPDQRDIDGNVLSVGDDVLYINARYGSGMALERGVIEEFKASVDSKTTTIRTVIKSKVSGELSTLNYPENMVSKL